MGVRKNVIKFSFDQPCKPTKPGERPPDVEIHRFDDYPIDQRENEVGVNFRGNFRDQLFLVNSLVLNTNLGGDRAQEGAFSLKPSKTAEIPPYLYIKNG